MTITRFRRTIAPLVLATIVVLAAAATPADASGLNLFGQPRTCQNGVRSAGSGYNLDATGFSSGRILVDGSIGDPCTDGQYALIYMRQVGIGDLVGPWTSIRTGSTRSVAFEKWMTRLAPGITDVQVKVCRTGSDPACSSSRYLHLI